MRRVGRYRLNQARRFLVGDRALTVFLFLAFVLPPGPVPESLCELNRDRTAIAQLEKPVTGTRTAAEKDTAAPHQSPDSDASRPAAEIGPPTQDPANRQRPPERQTFAPSEPIDADKAVDFPVDI
jgi:hypothetical protein